MIIFGTRASRIGTINVAGSQCDYCHHDQSQEITQFGNYFHVFWIPFFPIGRRTFGECTHCKRTIRKREFSPQLLATFNMNKSEIRRPIWHWSGLLIVAAMVLTVYISGLF